MTAILTRRQVFLTAEVLTDTTADVETGWFDIPEHMGFFLETISSASSGTYTVTLTLQTRFKATTLDAATAAVSSSVAEAVTGNATATTAPSGGVAALPRGNQMRLISTDDLIATETITLTVTAFFATPGTLLTVTIS